MLQNHLQLLQISTEHLFAWPLCISRLFICGLRHSIQEKNPGTGMYRLLFQKAPNGSLKSYPSQKACGKEHHFLRSHPKDPFFVCVHHWHNNHERSLAKTHTNYPFCKCKDRVSAGKDLNSEHPNLQDCALTSIAPWFVIICSYSEE